MALTEITTLWAVDAKLVFLNHGSVSTLKLTFTVRTCQGNMEMTFGDLHQERIPPCRKYAEYIYNDGGRTSSLYAHGICALTGCQPR